MPYAFIFAWLLPSYTMITISLLVYGFAGWGDKEKLFIGHLVLLGLIMVIGFMKVFDYATPYDTEFLKQGDNQLRAVLWVVIIVINGVMALRHSPSTS